MFDNSGAPSLELLRFRPDLGSRPEFEAALRQRVHRLRNFAHPSFACVRRVDHLEGHAALALVSNHTPGKRVSELLSHPRAQALAFELVRQLSPALAALHAEGDGITHGALGPDRIILTPERQLVIVEHVLGSALQSLGNGQARLTEAGVAVAPGSPEGRFDPANDYWQLAIVASSLLAGEPVTAEEFGAKVAPALDRLSSADGAGSTATATLRQWLEWALDLGHTTSAPSAALPTPAPDAVPVIRINPLDRRLAKRVPGPEFDPPDVVETARIEPSAPRETGQPFPLPAGSRPAAAIQIATPGLIPEGNAPDAAGQQGAPAPNPAATTPAAKPPTAPLRPTRPAPRPPAPASRVPMSWAAAVLFVLVAGGAIAIGVRAREVQVRGAAAAGGPVSVASPPTQPAHASNVEPARQATPPPAPRPNPVPPSRPARASRPAAPPSTGVRFSSPIVLQIYEGSRYLGSTADGAVALTPGRRELDLVNDSVGYRGRHILDVQNGQIMSIALASPRGRVTVEAAPGTTVFIDGKSVGSTPLASLSLPVGAHEFLFRHPQYGRRSLPVLIRADRLIRVSADFLQ
jgi:serine/threonine protein kinase